MIKVVKARFAKSGLGNLNKSVDDKIMHRLVNPLFEKKKRWKFEFSQICNKNVAAATEGLKIFSKIGK